MRRSKWIAEKTNESNDQPTHATTVAFLLINSNREHQQHTAESRQSNRAACRTAFRRRFTFSRQKTPGAADDDDNETLAALKCCGSTDSPRCFCCQSRFNFRARAKYRKHTLSACTHTHTHIHNAIINAFRTRATTKTELVYLCYFMYECARCVAWFMCGGGGAMFAHR